MYTFTPYYKSVIWGGDEICRRKGEPAPDAHIGESWEISPVAGCETIVADGPDKGLTLNKLTLRYGPSLLGKEISEKYCGRFPLLLKIIDAGRDLSVQVHPGEEMARRLHNCPGKTEMWYIVDHKPGAKIYNGFTRPITPDGYRKMVEQKDIMDVIQAHDAANGDVYFVPPGRIHAIGAGNLLIEVQQASDITYRVYDFDRLGADGHPRELHTELAAQAINFSVFSDHRIDYDTASRQVELLSCDYFDVALISPEDDIMHYDIPRDAFAIVICVEGECTVSSGDDTRSLPPLHSLLVPASEKTFTVAGRGSLLIAVPK
ncbi:MAG: type I phosphomannose isomerase catalytic subunit [Muribaculaceae bacterium]